MVDLIHCLANLLFSLIYYYINLSSSIICCRSPGDIYLSLGILLLALSKSYLNVIPLKSFLKHLLFYLQFYYQ